jgi:signal transduction histidine kinase
MKLKYLLTLLCIIIWLSAKSQTNATFDTFRKAFREYTNNAQIDSAKFYLQKMNNLALSVKSDSLLMVVNDKYAFFNFVQGDFEASANYLVKASNFALENKYQNIYLDMLNNLGMIFAKINEYNKAKEIYIRVLSLSDSTNMNNDYLSTLSNLGSAYQNLNKIDSAKVILEKGLNLAKENDDKLMIASLLKFLAKNKYLNKEYKAVINLVDEIEQNYDTIISPRLLDDAFFYRAQANFYLNNLKEAEKDIKKTLRLMEVQQKDPALVERLLFYSDLKERQKDYRKSLEIKNQVLVLKDSFDEVEMRQNVLDIEKKYQTEKKENENLQLKQEGFKKDLIISENRNNLLLIIVGFVLLLFFVIFYYLNNYRKKNKALNISIDKRIKLEKKLNNVRENIAQDFHDDLGNKLASITVLTDILSQKEISKNDKKIVYQIQENSDSLYKGTKDFIWSLNSKSDYLEELVTYLSDFGEEFFQKMNIDFKIKKDIKANISLPYYWSRHIILIFKEAMTNVAKHSKANDCEIRFLCDLKVLKIELLDNGNGFKKEDKKTQNGLINMQKRAKKIKGEIEVESTEKGTEIIFSAELPNLGS